MPEEKSDNSEAISIGRIPLKQVRVKRTESSSSNPMNRLVPYLDLFCRLDDEELARLAGVDEDVCATLRKQVVAIDRGLARYVDLLPRLSDGELVRLTGATAKTIRFWRLCQPRSPKPLEDASAGDGVVAKAATQKATTQPQPAAVKPGKTEPSPSESMTRGVVPSDSGHRLTAAEDSGVTAKPSTNTQSSAKRFMQFSGEPFPGFEAPGEEAEAEQSDGIQIDDISEEDLLDDPLRTL